MEAPGIDHSADLAGGTEELDRTELGQAEVRRIAEADGLAGGRTIRRRAVAQSEAWRHLALRLEAREPDGCATSFASSRVREVLERPGRVHAGALEDVTGQFVAPGQAATAILVDR